MALLISHPTTPPGGALSIDADVAISAAGARFAFTLTGANQVLWPPPAAPERADLLWKTTCFEAFLQPDGQDGYVEFNFSPSGRWAAYGFESYRTGMRHAAMAAAPAIGFERRGDQAILTATLAVWPVDLYRVKKLNVGLTAVIEQPGGAITCHALAHPSPQPDFHKAGGFALSLILD
jgi:hypothetical protein